MNEPDPLLRWRDEFPIVDRTRYLISNSLGAMPRAARASLQQYLDTWDQRGVRAWGEGWWVLQEEVGDRLAGILGVASGTVSMHQNVAIASQSILSCFSFDGTSSSSSASSSAAAGPGRRPRNKIVLVELEFPSNLYLYESQRAQGAEIVRVPADSSGLGIDLERLLAAIDERTLLVPLSHVLFRSAFIQDARAIVRRAREVGAFVILDVFQSVGTVPLQLAAWGVHAAVGGALKFLCGGPGNCFLYVDPEESKKLTPRFTGWAAHKRPFDFAPLHDLRSDGGRFAHGTPNVAALYAGREGIRIVGEIGLEAIRAKSQRQTALLVARAQELGFTVRAPREPAQRGGTVAVDVPHAYEVCQALNAEDFVVDYRPSAGIRIAPHFYTRDEECLAILARIREILETGEHLRYRGTERLPG